MWMMMEKLETLALKTAFGERQKLASVWKRVLVEEDVREPKVEVGSHHSIMTTS